MNEAEVLEVFKESKAYLDGHFLLTSGLHSPAYVEKFQVLQYPEHTSRLCRAIADKFKDDKIDVVVGPAVGGIILAYEVAKNLGTRGIFLEREDGKLVLRRGFSIGKEERVLIVEDIVTTGRSVFEVLEALEDEVKQDRIAGLAFLVDRSKGELDFKIKKQISLMRLDLPTYKAEECPLCKDGIPLTKRGSRNLKSK